MKTLAGIDDQAAWAVGLLGGLRLSDGAREITRLPSRAVTALLTRLALAPERAHAREELIELLWPGVELDAGRNRLRATLSTLKSILEPAGRVPARPVLQADRLCVRVVTGSLWCDAVCFERAARTGHVEEARALYRGELLPGLYDEWIDEERVRLVALHDRLPAPAIGAAKRPAVAPRDETRGPRAWLPTYLTRLFGAEEQAARLRSLVLAHRLVTLIGPGGSGKTRLAVEVAHSLRNEASPAALSQQARRTERFEVIAFVPLAGCTTRSQACDVLTGALQIASRGDDPLPALVEGLAGRRCLLVLDNFEQLVGAGRDLVERMTAQLPALHVVVTSRHALGLDGEQELAISALALPAIEEAAGPEAAGNPAVALFVERARAVRSDFHFNARNGAALVALVRELEGMPLAIELAASRVRSMAPAEMLARLRGEGTPHLDLLARAAPRGGFDARHSSMQSVIQWSWEQLDATQARVLSALTVFPADFTAVSAAALLADEPVDIALQLDELAASSLLYAQGAGGDTLRFDIYRPIREFATVRQDEAAARRLRLRLVAWSLAWANALPRTPSLQTLRSELPNLMAAMACAVAEHAVDDAIELLLAMRRFIDVVEWPAEGLLHARAAIEACADPLRQARGRAVLGPMLFTAGRAEEAVRHLELALRCEQLDAAQRARALHALARVRWRATRRGEGVEPLLAEAEALIGASAEPELRASLLALRAFVTDIHHRDHAGAVRLHAQALAIWEELGGQHAINSGRYNLAVCAQNAGLHRAALEQLGPVIASVRELHDWHRLGQSLNVKGNANSGLREWAQAVADYRECIAIAWNNMASFHLADGLWNMPRALAHLRQPEAAIRLVACASNFWCSRFGDLIADDRRYLLRVRRLAARQIGAPRVDALWREGEKLSVSEGVALALSPLSQAP